MTSSIAGVLNRLEKLNEFALAVRLCGSGQYKYTCGIPATYCKRCTSSTCAASSPRPVSPSPVSCSVQPEVQKRRPRPHRHLLRLAVAQLPGKRQIPTTSSPSEPTPHSANFLNNYSTTNSTNSSNNQQHTSSSSQQPHSRRSWNSNHNHNNTINNNSNSNNHHNKYVHHCHNTLSSLLVSWIILVLFFLTTTMAAPIGSSTTPKWVNPCGVNPDQVLGSHEVEIPPLKPSELYNNIALQAQLAKEQADEVSPQYVLEAFKDPQFPNYSKELSYKWLPIIPEPTGDHVEGLQAEEALRSSYEYLQFYAVGLEQIVLDQIVYEGTFLDEFRQMEGKLRQVLCEIQLAMLEMKFKQNADVTREVMAQEFRDMDSKTARDLRDWIILRDYIGALNYISTVFADFKARADAQEGSS